MYPGKEPPLLKSNYVAASRIFQLILSGDKDDKQHAMRLMQTLTPGEVQELGFGCERLKAFTEEVWKTTVFRQK